MNIRASKRCLGFLLLLAGSCITASAQERFAVLTGTVKDPTEAALPGVKVSLTSKATERTYAVTTGADGKYIAQSIEPGRYSLTFEAMGFATTTVDEINLLVGRTATMDILMTVGNTAESITVTETAPLIDFTSTKVANNVSAEEIDLLPKARSFQQLAMLATSVNSGEIEGGFQVNGASGAENQFNIDGVSTTSLINGKSRQNAITEILAEVQVKSAGYEAEYGGAMGGVITAVTRSGGNQFHGNFYYYLSGNSISAGPVQRLVLDPVTEKSASYFQDDKFDDTRHEIGGTLGGPIVKDKLFFFTAFSPQFRNASREYLFSNGTEPGKLSTDQTFHMWFNKLSWEITPKLRANFTYLWTPTKSNGRLLSYSGAGTNWSTQTLAGAAPNDNIGYFQPQSNYSGQIDYTPTSTIVINLRGGRFFDDYKTTGIPGIAATEYATTAVGLPFSIPTALQQAAGYSNTPRQINTFYDLATRTYFQADVSKYANFWGAHTIKAGWGVSKTVNKIQEIYPGGGYVRIYWNGAFDSPTLGNGQRGQYGYYEVNDRGTRGTTGGTIQNVYVQDAWNIKGRLTLSLGVRLENEKVPSFRRDIRDNAFEFGFGDKVAPHFGASFDLLGNGKVKVYGSWNRQFDWVKYELSRGTFGGDTWCIHYRTLDTLDVFNLAETLPGQNIWAADGSCRDRRVPSFDLLDPGLKPMSSDLMTVGTEFELSSSMVLRVGYVHNNLRRTIEDLGALDAQGNEVYLYGNPGEGEATINPVSGATDPFPMPKPKRVYDAMEIQLTRRFSRGFFFNASYTLSRLYGNYAGLANSDEITLPTTNVGSATSQQQGGSVSRQGGNANRSWDLDEILWDSHGNLDVTGRLNTDRPHVFKFYGAKQFSFGTNVGIGFYAGSGTPVTTQVYTRNQVPVFVNGRGDLGRTPVLTQTDLNVYHDFHIGETKSIRFEFNMLNLFNQKTSRATFNYLNRGAGGAQPGSAISLATTDLAQGYDYIALINATSDQQGTRGAYDPRFGMKDLFNTGFQGRFGVKFTF